jgi:hypothetical protein
MVTMNNELAIQPGPLPQTLVHRGKLRELIGRHQLIMFFVLAFVFSWYPWIIAIFRGQTSGPNPLGPLIAALIVTGLAEGRSSLALISSAPP